MMKRFIEKVEEQQLQTVPKSRKTKCDGRKKRNAFFEAKTKCASKIPILSFRLSSLVKI